MNQKTSIFHYVNNYGSLTRVTRLKVAVNRADPTLSFIKYKTNFLCIFVISYVSCL